MELINGESICVFSDEITIEIGVNSNISIPGVICLGEPFDVVGNASIAIEIIHFINGAHRQDY